SRSGNGLKAANYLLLAAQQAMSRSAFSEANDQLTAALNLFRALPENREQTLAEIDVRVNLAICLAGVSSIEASLNILEPARQLCAKVGDEAIRLRVLEFLEFTYCTLIEHQEEARSAISEVQRIGERLHDARVVGRARFWKGYASTYEGDLLAANEEFD